MTVAHLPQEVLDAVRRLEADLDAMRSRSRARDAEIADLRGALAADAADERLALVEDLERLVELVGAGWRSTHDQIAALGRQMSELRAIAESAAGTLDGGRLNLEVRLGPLAASNGSNGS